MQRKSADPSYEEAFRKKERDRKAAQRKRKKDENKENEDSNHETEKDEPTTSASTPKTPNSTPKSRQSIAGMLARRRTNYDKNETIESLTESKKTS